MGSVCSERVLRGDGMSRSRLVYEAQRGEGFRRASGVGDRRIDS